MWVVMDRLIVLGQRAAAADSLELLVVCAGQLVRSIGDIPCTHDGHQLHADVKCRRMVIHVDDLQVTQSCSTRRHDTMQSEVHLLTVVALASWETVCIRVSGVFALC